MVRGWLRIAESADQGRHHSKRQAAGGHGGRTTGAPRLEYVPDPRNPLRPHNLTSRKTRHDGTHLSNPQTWIAFVTLTFWSWCWASTTSSSSRSWSTNCPKPGADGPPPGPVRWPAFMRIGLLLVLAWIIGLVTPPFSAFGKDISGRDLILILGLVPGLESCTEIHHSIGRRGEQHASASRARSRPSSCGIMRLVDLNCPARFGSPPWAWWTMFG